MLVLAAGTLPLLEEVVDALDAVLDIETLRLRENKSGSVGVAL